MHLWSDLDSLISFVQIGGSFFSRAGGKVRYVRLAVLRWWRIKSRCVGIRWSRVVELLLDYPPSQGLAKVDSISIGLNLLRLMLFNSA